MNCTGTATALFSVVPLDTYYVGPVAVGASISYVKVIYELHMSLLSSLHLYIF